MSPSIFGGMARPVRIIRPGAWYHITARGTERTRIFHDDKDRRHLCELLEQFVERFALKVHAYVFMSNHYHLLLETPQGNLSQAMQWLNVSYTVWFNRRHQRCGPLFQGRFKAIIFDPLEAALALSRYLHLNPVRTARMGLDQKNQRAIRQGLSARPDPQLVKERIAKLRAHRWSSYLAYIGRQKPPAWLECEEVLQWLGKGQGSREQAYARYVEQAVREGLEESPWEKLTEQVVLGSRKFRKSVQKFCQGNERESPGLKRLKGMPTWEQAVAVVEKIKGEKWRDFRDRYGDWGRDLTLYLGQRRCGMRLKELGERVGGLDYGSVSVSIRRLEQRAEGNPKMARLLKAANAELSND